MACNGMKLNGNACFTVDEICSVNEQNERMEKSKKNFKLMLLQMDGSVGFETLDCVCV